VSNLTRHTAVVHSLHFFLQDGSSCLWCAYIPSTATFYESICCPEPLQITWSSDGSSPPYYLSLIPGLTFLGHLYAVYDAHHQLSISGAAQRERGKPFSFRVNPGNDVSPCRSLSSFLRSKGLAIPGKRSPYLLTQDCMYKHHDVFHSMYLHPCQSTVALKDGNGQQVYSAPATVQNGGDSGYGDLGCLSSRF